MVRDKTRVFAFALCVVFVLISVGILLSNQTSHEDNLASFDCRLSSSSEAFSVEVEVELSDGMDENEAINVATIVLSKALVVNLNERIESHLSGASLDHDGVWALKLTWIMRTRGIHHAGSDATMYEQTTGSFEAIIDSINQTVEYSFA